MEGNSPDLSEIPEISQKSAAGHVVDEQLGGYDNGASEVQGSPTPEKNPVQEKISLIMDMVRSKNTLLGGKFGREVALKDGSSIFVFGRTTSDRVGRVSRVYGVDSTQGPISISGGGGVDVFATEERAKEVDLEEASKSLMEDGRRWVRPVEDKPQNNLINPIETLEDWDKSFESSIQAVLKDPEAMKQIEEQKVAVLDKALEAASKPIDINVAPTTPSSSTPNE